MKQRNLKTEEEKVLRRLQKNINHLATKKIWIGNCRYLDRFGINSDKTPTRLKKK